MVGSKYDEIELKRKKVDEQGGKKNLTRVETERKTRPKSELMSGAAVKCAKILQ